MCDIVTTQESFFTRQKYLMKSTIETNTVERCLVRWPRMRCWYIDAYVQGLTSWFSDVVEQNATLTPTHRPTDHPTDQDTTVSNTRQLSSLKLASRSSHLYQNVKPNSSPLELLLPLSTSLTHKTQLKRQCADKHPPMPLSPVVPPVSS